MELERIKYRAKDSVTKRWVYGFPYKSSFGNWFILTEINKYHVLEETLGQYTGLKDKNGKEIYEGDIVRYKEANDEITTSKVRFVDAAFSPITEICWMGDGECEIIGNIFDNKNLLEQ